MSEHHGISRRTALGVLAGAAAGTALSGGSPFSPAFAAKTLTVGFIYVGPSDDFGYNQAHAEGGGDAAQDERRQGGRGGERRRDRRRPEDHGEHDQPGRRHAGLPDLVRLFRPAHAEGGAEVSRTCSSAIAAACARPESKHPTNTGTYFGYIDEGQYLNGIVAGHATKSKKLGFVAAKPIPQVLLNINAFTLGARSVDPTITTQVIFTGDWSLPVKEAEATNGLVDPGRRCHHLPRRQPQGGGRDRRAARHLHLRLPRQPGPAGAQGLPDRRRVELGHGLQGRSSRRPRPASRLANFVRGGLKDGFVKTSALRPGGQRRSEGGRPTPSRPKMMKGGFPSSRARSRTITARRSSRPGSPIGQTASSSKGWTS